MKIKIAGFFALLCIGLIAYFQSEPRVEAVNASATSVRLPLQATEIGLMAKKEPNFAPSKAEELASKVGQSSAQTTASPVVQASPHPLAPAPQQADPGTNAMDAANVSMTKAQMLRSQVGKNDEPVAPSLAKNSPEFAQIINEKINATNEWHARVANDPQLQAQIEQINAKAISATSGQKWQSQ